MLLFMLWVMLLHVLVDVVACSCLASAVVDVGDVTCSCAVVDVVGDVVTCSYLVSAVVDVVGDV